VVQAPPGAFELYEMPSYGHGGKRPLEPALVLDDRQSKRLMGMPSCDRLNDREPVLWRCGTCPAC